MSTVFELRQELDSLYGDSYEFDVGANELVLITVVHDSFNKKTREQRLAPLQALIENAGLKLSIAELYTSSEARERGIAIERSASVPPASWGTAVSMIASGEKPAGRAAGAKPRRVVFYSYKGGVGRTTALVHTAFHLARSGERVVVVDLDVEAPGLHKLLPRQDEEKIEAGIVDFLWERQVLPFETEASENLTTCLVAMGDSHKRKAISYVVEDESTRAQVHVIPAGVVGNEYVQRLFTLSSEMALARADDAWAIFEKELVEQIDPDVLLIDARTGLGDWGGLSLLRLADEVFLVMFPSEQNAEGIRFVRETLSSLSNVNTHLILSPVPEGPIGKEIVAKFLPQLKLSEDEVPTEVYYNPGVAGALTYPLEAAMSGYARIANILMDSEAEDKAEASMSRVDRKKVIESLNFPEREAKAIAASDFETFFQKTSDFDKFLDDARWVVRGRKGTGKSTLFHLFVEHKSNAMKRARGRLENVDILPGHGPSPASVFRPTTDVFEEIQKDLVKGQHDWLSFWRAYAIVRIFVSRPNLIDSLPRAGTKALRDYLKQNFGKVTGADYWKSSHTQAILGLLSDPYKGLCRDFMIDVNNQLNADSGKLWLLYDDLDQDIKEESQWQEDALGGLLRLAYDSNNQDLHNIRFKVFLREDIWDKLVFTNKSHFSEPRTLLLQWKIEDFLRLAYRLVTGGSSEFRAIALREFPLTDTEVDSAGEEDLRKALVPFCGLGQEKGKNATVAKWVYNRLTDAQGNTYPRSLTVLLHNAREEELRTFNGKQLPTDRLISPRSMQVGLEAASVERVNALKNEYPSIRPFLEDIENNQTLRSQFTSSELRGAWSRCGEPFGAFEAFVSHLNLAGLLVKKKPEAKFDFGIASLYIDGLKINRVQGEKK